MMVTACLLLVCMLLSGCAKEPIANDVTIMTVDGNAVTMEDYRYYYLALKSQYDNGSESYWKNNKADRAQLKTLAEQYLLQYLAYDKMLSENNYTANEAEIKSTDDYIAEVRKSYKTEEEFQKLLTDNYLTEEAYKKSLLRTAMLNRYLFDYNKEKNADAVAKQLEKYVRVKHVLVKFGGTDGRSQSEAKKIADQVMKDARSGADFDALVAEFGEDPGMENNTDGYYFTEGKMVKEFEEASFKLKDGEVSEPVESTYGYHVIVRLPMEEAYLQSHFSEIFSDDKFYESFDEELKKTIEGLEVSYEKIYNNVDIETVK